MDRNELETELSYRMTERLALLCEDRKPTRAELEIAMREIKEWSELVATKGEF